MELEGSGGGCAIPGDASLGREVGELEGAEPGLLGPVRGSAGAKGNSQRNATALARLIPSATARGDRGSGRRSGREGTERAGRVGEFETEVSKKGWCDSL